MKAGSSVIPASNYKPQVWLIVAILIFPFVIYFYTLRCDYALDDAIVITENQYTLKGFGGLKDIFTHDAFEGFFKEKKSILPGGRYRPLSIASFAIEYAFFKTNAGLSHFFNIVFYALTGLFLYLILCLMFRNNRNSLFRFLPAVATFIFIFHPVHSEVVANIKGRDEIFALLFSLIALYSSIKYVNNGYLRWIVIAFLSFFAALLSKENALMFIAIIPLTLFFFFNVFAKKLIPLFLSLLTAVILFVIIRTSVTGGFQNGVSDELMNNPYLYAAISQKAATIAYVLGYYLKILVWPHPLTFDYYPYHVALTGWSNPLVILSVLIYAFLLVFALLKLTKKHTVSYSIFFYIIALLPVSNLFFNIGTFMNERFLFQASIGFSIAFGWLIIYILTGMVHSIKNQVLVLKTVMSIVLLASGLAVFSRTTDWKNDYTLFLTDVKTSANSAKSNCSAGGILYETSLKIYDANKKKQRLDSALKYLNKAIVIHPAYGDAWRLKGNVLFELNHDVTASFDCYLMALKINSSDEVTYNNIRVIFSKFDSTDQKINMYKVLLGINIHRAQVNYAIGYLYGKEKNDLRHAVFYLKNAVELQPDYNAALKDLGVAYGIMGRFDSSLYWLDKAVNIAPDDPEIYRNLGITTLNMGDKNKAMKYFERARQLKNNNTESK